MKIHKTFALASVLMFSLSSCGGSGYTYHLADYVKNIAFHDNFRIMQLTDIHIGIEEDLDIELSYLDKIYNHASNPDLVIITGDCFMVANSTDVQRTFAFFDSKQIPWAIVWGNHDRQGLYSPSYLLQQANNTQYGLFADFRDDIYGDSNYIVNLIDGSGVAKWQIYLMDSNSYYDGGGLKYQYDIVHQDQLDWYAQTLSDSKVGGNYVPSLVFMHIPLYEFYDAWFDDSVIKEGVKHEGVSYGYKNNNFFDLAKDIGSTKAFFCGHDHINNYAAKYEGIVLSYGMKSSHNIYHEEELMGYQIITLDSTGSLDLNDIERVVVWY